MKIRRARQRDLKRISEIFRKEFAKKPYNERWTEKTALKRITNYFKDNYFFVLEEDKIIAGFLIGEIYLWDKGMKGGLSEVIVLSEYQGKGYGKKLISYFENFLKQNKIKKIQLMSVKSSKAFKVYNKLGYKEQNFVAMEKKLI